MANAADFVESIKLSTVTSSTAQLATFVSACQEVYITATQSMHLKFLGSPATSSNFLLPANTPMRFVFSGANVMSVSAIADSTSGDVYVMGVKT